MNATSILVQVACPNKKIINTSSKPTRYKISRMTRLISLPVRVNSLECSENNDSSSKTIISTFWDQVRLDCLRIRSNSKKRRARDCLSRSSFWSFHLARSRVIELDQRIDQQVEVQPAVAHRTIRPPPSCPRKPSLSRITLRSSRMHWRMSHWLERWAEESVKK